MMPQAVMLFPDTGPAFMRSLAASALYAERVQALTFTTAPSDEVVEAWKQAEAKVVDSPHSTILQRMGAYLQFMQEAAPRLSALVDAGVLLPGPATDFGVVHGPREDATSRLAAVPDFTLPRLRPMLQAIESAYEAAPPSFADFDAIAVYLRAAEGEQVDLPTDPDLWSRVFFMRYLTTVVAVAERHGLVPVTWDPRFSRGLAACRSLYVGDLGAGDDDQAKDLLVRRQMVEAALGQTILERTLPGVDDLPFDDILELRQRRKPELAALRSAIASLAAEVDLDSSNPEHVELQIRDLVASRVDPALHDLSAALYASRIGAVGRLAQSAGALRAAALPAALAVTVGAPISVAAACGGASALAAPLLEAFVERRKVERASQWSVLLKLKRRE